MSRAADPHPEIGRLCEWVFVVVGRGKSISLTSVRKAVSSDDHDRLSEDGVPDNRRPCLSSAVGLPSPAQRCCRAAPTAFPTRRYTARLASYVFAVCILGHFRELPVKSVRKPDARNQHVRFDERGRETGRLRSVPALFLDSTPLIPNILVE
jgi:hypothetical protein